MRVDPHWPVLLGSVVVLVWLGRTHLGLDQLWSLVRRGGATLLVLLAALQLQFTSRADPPSPTSVDLLLVVDRTTSMGATDLGGAQPRMTGVASDVAELMEAMPGARVCVVAADNEARVVTPWTTDGSAVVTAARTIGWREEGYGTGSDISVGVPIALEQLTAASRARPGAARYLVYFGDGEQTTSTPPRSFAPLRPLLTDSLVLGYGTAEGATMSVRPGADELVQRDGVPQVSRIDEAALGLIADQLGGRYQHRTAPGELSAWPTALGGPGAASGDLEAPQPSWWLGLAAAVLLVLDLSCSARRAAQAREEMTA